MDKRENVKKKKRMSEKRRRTSLRARKESCFEGLDLLVIILPNMF